MVTTYDYKNAKLRLIFRIPIFDTNGYFIGYECISRIIDMPNNIPNINHNIPNINPLPELIYGEWIPMEIKK